MSRLLRSVLVASSILASTVAFATDAASVTPAERVYRNGVIFTADAMHGSAQAIAIRDGKIAYVGSDNGLDAWIGPSTERVDLHGRFVMPGLVDGHMHPLQAGTQLLKCGLDYASLTVAEFQTRIQKCLDEAAAKEPDAWLEVVSWFQESMLPVGVTTSHATLDVLETVKSYSCCKCCDGMRSLASVPSAP